MAGPDTNKQKAKKSFRSELLNALIPNEALRNSFLAGNDALGIEEIKSYLNTKASKEAGLGNPNGSANNLNLASSKIDVILEAFRTLNTEKVSKAKKVKAFQTLTVELKSMFKYPDSPNYLPRLINSYLKDYSGKVLSSSQMSKLASLSQALFNAYQKINCADLTDVFENCAGQLSQSKQLGDAIKGADDTCREEADSLGIDPQNIDQGIREWFNKKEQLYQDFLTLRKEIGLKTRKKAEVENENRELIENADKEITDAVENLKSAKIVQFFGSRQLSDDLLVAEKEIESYDKYYSTYKENRQSLLAEIKKLETVVAEQKAILSNRIKASNEVKHYRSLLEEYQKDPEFIQKVNMHNTLKERYDSYKSACNNLRFQAEVDSIELNDSLKEYRKARLLGKADINEPKFKILQDYFLLREQLICAIYSDEEKQAELRKEFEEKFEAKQPPRSTKKIHGLLSLATEQEKTPIDHFLETYNDVIENKFETLIKEAENDPVIIEFDDIKKKLNKNKKLANTGWGAERKLSYAEAALKSKKDRLELQNKSYQESVELIYKHIHFNVTPDKFNIENWGQLKKDVSDYRANIGQYADAFKRADIQNLEKDLNDLRDKKTALEKKIKSQEKAANKEIERIQKEINDKALIVSEMNEQAKDFQALKAKHLDLLQLKSQKEALDLSILSRNRNIPNRAYPNMALNALESFSVMLNPGKDPNKNSREFQLLYDNLSLAKKAMKDTPKNHRGQKAAIENLQKAAEDYLKAKNAQWFRFWPFISGQRYLRMKGAANLIDFCNETKAFIKEENSKQIDTLEKLDKLKKDNQKLCESIEKSTEKLLELTSTKIFDSNSPSLSESKDANTSSLFDSKKSNTFSVNSELEDDEEVIDNDKPNNDPAI